MSRYQDDHKSFRPSLSHEEIRVLKECNHESFYFRCLPLAGLLSAGVFLGARRGFIKGFRRTGFFPHYTGALFFGYVFGKVSYREACVKKIFERVPDSSLAEVLKKQQSGAGFLNRPQFEDNQRSLEQPPSLLGSSLMDDHPPDFQSHNEGLDSYNQVTESLSPYKENEVPDRPASVFTSYEDLRKENRKEYNSKLSEKYKKQLEELNTTESEASSQPRLESPSPPPPKSYLKQKTNKYGDTWEE